MAARSRARHSVAARASQSQQVLAQIQADPSLAKLVKEGLLIWAGRTVVAAEVS